MLAPVEPVNRHINEAIRFEFPTPLSLSVCTKAPIEILPSSLNFLEDL